MESDDRRLYFVYPNGCTMDVQPPSTVILSSGGLSFPCKRPICGVWQEDAVGRYSPGAGPSGHTRRDANKGGRLLAIGSTDMFADEWLDEVHNKHLVQTFVNFLLGSDGDGDYVLFDRAKSLQDSDNMHRPCIEEARVVPDIEALSERLKWCLEENPPIIVRSAAAVQHFHLLRNAGYTCKERSKPSSAW